MDEALLRAYLATDYQVRLPDGRRASLRVDAPVPTALARWLGIRPWVYLTAWNPQSRPRAFQVNRLAQRSLLAALEGRPVLAGVGIGPDGWRESSLLVAGLDVPEADALGHRFGQLAYLHGSEGGPARLRWL
ncbi:MULTISPECIES: DUF3293 domain-containing protein [Dyella]|uniref:DUF3293 domain-containing protein n=2 Tax=Dyella TaxID=231454 RepID=A0A4R0YV08_9GAMM|nr:MULTISPECIES: DUF3293 domain-containing protein [Dyella]TBR39148.1 DUF3293 domain-containing protein [Dyella terrae]TCI13265.1 DUF3293 domain-containing protein [Dyella soli]